MKSQLLCAACVGVMITIPCHVFGQESAPSSGVVSDSSINAAVPKTIGVMAHSDFVPDRVQPQKGKLIGLPDDLAGRIIEHLATSRRFILVERSALRRVVLEQRFGRDLQQTYLDRTLDKAIDAMEHVEGGAVAISSGEASPTGAVKYGLGTVGVVGTLSDYNDLVKDFQDLGGAVSADYLVLGNLEKLVETTEQTQVPYSTTGRTLREDLVDARLRLRVIDVKSGTVAGATSIRTSLSEQIFEGKRSDTDAFTFYDHLGRLAATKVLDVTFPARIVSGTPLVISRGTNDGVVEGDIYLVEREGKELTDDGGMVIATLKDEIGHIEVTEIQQTVSVVRPIAGESFREGDLVSLATERLSMAPSVATEASVPLGAGTESRRALGSAPLPRVAIGLVKSESTARNGKDASQHTPIFTDTIISRLTQTKRFQLIDRQEVDQLLTEQLAQALVEGKDMPSAMGTLKGADYLVYGSLASFGIEDRVLQLPNSTRMFTQKTGHVDGNMRIVDARSGDVLESRKISVAEPVEAGASGPRTVTTLADAYAEQVVLMLMNAIYPIKVAHVGGDGTIYVNRGDDGGLFVGEFLDAFSVGQAVIDPDTGVQLGVEETLVGQVALTEVEDARSKAGLTTGGPLSRGDLLKRTLANKDKRPSVAAREQDTAPQRTGGTMPAQPVEPVASPQEKPTLAVGLLRLNPAARTTGFGQGHIKRLSDDLIVKLHNTNRFVLMERQEVDQILDEKAFEAVASGGDIQDRLRELQGADYLIHGEVANFYIDVQEKKVAYLNETERSATAVAEGMFRIVDVHTGETTTGEKIRVSEQVQKVNDTTRLMSDLMDRFTTDSIAAIVARLYPIKVLGMTVDGVVYLNRGEDAGLSPGIQFDVMRPGQDLIDPDSAQSFGRAETKVASVEIVSVEFNRSQARFVSGSDAQSGDVLRRSAVITEKVEPKTLQPAW